MNDPRFAPKHGPGGYIPHFETIEAVVAAFQPSEPVYCLRPAELRANAARFRDGFAGEVLYAMKCNPHPLVLSVLRDSGIARFDVASLFETAAARDAGAGACYMHPVKPRGDLAEAYRFHGVRLFTLDHRDELEKMSDVLGDAPGVCVLVRFATPDSVARYTLSAKFGASPADAATLLRAVSERGWQTGLACHVGSQCLRPQDYGDAIERAAGIAAAAGVALEILDLGGGFPVPYRGEEAPPLSAYFDAIRDGVRKAALDAKCRLLCEPGRALVASACSMIVQVHLRKDDTLYLNDGIYHSLSEAVTGGLSYPMRLLRADHRDAAPGRPFTLYGPTCDSTDVLPGYTILPGDIREGDWIEIGQLGAYSNAVATRFNGIFPNRFVTVDSPPLLP
jgi:ornithine decarboxylase